MINQVNKLETRSNDREHKQTGTELKYNEVKPKQNIHVTPIFPLGIVKRLLQLTKWIRYCDRVEVGTNLLIHGLTF